MYTKKFFENQQQGSINSAKVVVPLVIDLVAPKTVVDVGCGTGTWLSQFIANGVQDVVGVDGDWVKVDMLQIPKEKFVSKNLTWSLDINRSFDLAMSLEVAEHLDAQYADVFVRSLVKLAPVVLFSAAIPHQGGTHHVNEQWPDYWVKRFADNGYEVIDPLRRKLWSNTQVSSWYAQNILFFVDKTKVSNYPALEAARAYTFVDQLSLVHPRNGNYGVGLLEMCKRRTYEYVINPIKSLIGK